MNNFQIVAIALSTRGALTADQAEARANRRAERLRARWAVQDARHQERLDTQVAVARATIGSR